MGSSGDRGSEVVISMRVVASENVREIVTESLGLVSKLSIITDAEQVASDVLCGPT